MLGFLATAVLVFGLLRTLFDLDLFEVAAVVVVQLAVKEGVAIVLDYIRSSLFS